MVTQLFFLYKPLWSIPTWDNIEKLQIESEYQLEQLTKVSI